MTIQGSIFGLAYGDALGKPTEFLPMEEITRRYGALGPANLPKGGKVTDDTQMMIYVGEALVKAAYNGYLTPANTMTHLHTALVDWLKMTDASRAPGTACMSACLILKRGAHWLAATNPDSKGCGANMRVTPIGLATWRMDATAPGQVTGFLTREEAAGIAQLQAAMTHGHPTALAASDATAHLTWLALSGTPVRDLLPALLEYCRSQRKVYHADWLGELWTLSKRDRSPEAFIRRGWDETIAALWTVERAMVHPQPKRDPCRATGAGWIAEEALATALHCVLLYADDPVRAVRRGAASSGDSDSLAAIAGAVMGAAYGIGAFPTDWYTRIEYRTRLDKLTTDLM